MKIEPVISTADLSHGVLVAVTESGGREPDRIKRVVGLPGETISIAKDGNGLLVDGEEIAVRLTRRDAFTAYLPVDFDRLRRQSRWSCPIQPSDWTRGAHATWHCNASAESWLVYHHANVYTGGDASSVKDDCPFNHHLTRRLFNSWNLLLSAKAQLASPDQTIRVAFWLPSGNVVVNAKPSASGRLLVSSLDPALEAVAAADVPADLCEQNPIAIQASAGVMIRELVTLRRVHYRLRKSDPIDVYPLRLDDDEFFVLGDNVPVSVDSRQYGQIKREQIRGLVAPVKPQQADLY